MAGLTPEQLTKIRNFADKNNIKIPNTSEGRKNLDKIRKRFGFKSGGSVSANSISDKDVEKLKEMLQGKSSSANSISNRDVAKMKEMFKKKAASKALRNNKSANSISNRDVDLIKKSFGMKKGGLVKYKSGGAVGNTTSNFKGCY